MLREKYFNFPDRVLIVSDHDLDLSIIKLVSTVERLQQLRRSGSGHTSLVCTL